MGYTVYLMTSTYNTNSYGYWTGKNYTVQGELYPTIKILTLGAMAYG
jgi:hypothetical protein